MKGKSEKTVTHADLLAYRERLISNVREVAFNAAMRSEGLANRDRDALRAADELRALERCFTELGVEFEKRELAAC